MMAAKSNGAVKDSSELAAAHIKFNSAVTNLGHPTRQKKKSPTVSLLNQPVYSHSPDSQPFELSTDFPNLVESNSSRDTFPSHTPTLTFPNILLGPT
uniref:Uncharacterized protein n=1 Tax=Cucumis melo TaxID=3656 RepID=A0A9I9EAS3_CUCME